MRKHLSDVVSLLALPCPALLQEVQTNQTLEDQVATPLRPKFNLKTKTQNPRRPRQGVWSFVQYQMSRACYDLGSDSFALLPGLTPPCRGAPCRGAPCCAPCYTEGVQARASHSVHSTPASVRGWRTTVEMALFQIWNPMKTYPSVFHAYNHQRNGDGDNSLCLSQQSYTILYYTILYDTILYKTRL